MTAASPLRLSFEVACSPEHAFRVWTSRISTWWPRDHTVTGQAEQVVMQGDVGGRIYERTADGAEHDWGEVTVWQPPARLAYVWHLGLDRARATEVDIRFVASGESATTVEIEHRGWERLGKDAPAWRERNAAGWHSVLPHFQIAAEKADTQDGDI
ncbi:MAG TPA: SRPBCC domain-containing protein [Streptosporangiaceae bacterium]|nr:SRPBCC domain-containing protein [Streptosporangiaceae bacterium]